MPSLNEHARKVACAIVSRGPGTWSPAELGLNASVVARIFYDKDGAKRELELALDELGYRFPRPWMHHGPIQLVCPRGRPCRRGCGRHGPPFETNWEGWVRERGAGKDAHGHAVLTCPACYAAALEGRECPETGGLHHDVVDAGCPYCEVDHA
jgi:hypothetical protein